MSVIVISNDKTVRDLETGMGAGASTNGVEAIAKTNGDAAFRSQDYMTAIVYYTEAIESASHSTETFNLFESAVVFSNRSAAFYLCGQYEHALADGASAVNLQPTWPKGYFRHARALQKCDRFIEALDNLLIAEALAPVDPTIQTELQQLQEYINKHVTAQGVGCTFSWGLGSTGGLGHPDGGKDKRAPSSVAALARRHVLDVACGAMHTVAVAATGEVYAWGDNKYGQVGIIQPPSQHVRSEVPGATLLPVPRILPGLIGVHVTAVSCGAGHTVVCARDGRVFSWGVGQQGQLGHNSLLNAPEPTHITRLTNEQHTIAAITCGIAHTFFLTTLGQLLACGQNTYGALGMNTEAEAVLVPTCIEVNFQETAVLGHGQGASRVVHISCGGAHTAVVDSRGRLYTTGSNTCGQLGLGHLEDFVCSFSQVTEFVGMASTDVGVIRDLQTKEEIFGRQELPVCAYVSCGEEFTTVISREHSVYTVGLGLGGQLGLASNPDKLHTFHLVSTLEEKGIEEVSCSQGTVFAVSHSGDVYTWGVSVDQALSRNYTEEDIKIIPIQSNAFRNRKRARQIACGRKHYMLLTIAPYGPTSEPIKGLLPMSRFEDQGETEMKGNEDSGVCGSGVYSMEAGKKFKFDIQSKDARGDNVSFGGSIFQGRISRSCILVEEESSWRDGITTPYSEVAIDDNFDGIYSGDCRFYEVGNYNLILTLDGLHVKGSPFAMTVTPTALHGPNCVVSFKTMLASSGVAGQSSDETVLEPGQTATVWMRCFDKYHNKHPTVESTYIFVECCDDKDTVVYQDCMEILINPASLASFDVTSPRERGAYRWTFGVGGLKEAQRLPGVLESRVITGQLCPSRCTVQVPSSAVAGESIPVIIILKDAQGKTVKPDPDIDPYRVSSVLTPSSEHSICSRAIIQLYPSFGCILTPSVGQLQPLEFEHHPVLEHVVKVAGEAEVEIRVEGIVVSVEKLCIVPCVTSPLFVELMSVSTALSNWQDVSEQRLLLFQCNDQYGNARGVGGDIVVVTMWQEGQADNTERHVHVSCYDQGNGFYDAHISVMNGDMSSVYVLQVTVNDEEICYSPFSFNHIDVTTSEQDNLISSAEILEIEELKKEKAKTIKSQKEKQKLAQIEQANLDKFERLRKQELTNRRAMEALEKEKRKRSREREERRLNRMSKRTGGGFIVQFSKDI